MAKGDGLIIGLVLIGIPVAVIAADFTILNGKLGISSMFCSKLNIGCGTSITQRQSQQNPNVKEAVKRVREDVGDNPLLLQSRFLQPQSNFVRHAYVAAGDRITVSS